MSTLNSKTYSLQDYDFIASSINEGTSLSLIKILHNSSIGTFDFLKSTLSLLNCLVDLQSTKPLQQSTLMNLKQIVKEILEIMIEPLIKDLIMAQTTEIQYKHQLMAQALSKWWLNYLSLLHLAYLRKRTLPGWNESCSKWLPKEEWLFFDKSLQALKGFLPWKMLLLRGVCAFDRSGLLHQYLSPSDFKHIWEEILSHFCNISQKEIQDAELIHIKTNSLEYRCKILSALAEILNAKSEDIAESLILKESLKRGRFDKKTYKKLPHSVIIGWDGGFYALMNTITEDEKTLMLEGGDISQDYADRWEKQENNKFKLIIGKGAFGKIRLCMALTRNESSNKMKPGEIMCVKKSLVFQEESYLYSLGEMNQNVWNDYSSGEVSNLIFSPEVYDLTLLTNASSFAIEAHQKGYSMQKFIAVYDGSKIFLQNGKFFRQWEHQRNYILTLFEVVSSLLSHGVCMTDLKPENTLYDGENGRATLIDLAGVVRKKNKEELKCCKISEVTEYTVSYTAPEILNGNETVDLHKCMSYSLGKIIENIAFTPAISKTQTKPYHKSLRNISEDLLIEEDTEEESRISVDEALERIKQLPSSTNSDKIEEMLKEFLHLLLERTKVDLRQFGLNPDIERIETNFISLMSAPLDPEKVENQDFTDLQVELDSFLAKEISKENRNNIFVLLGSSGSGKSTILQLNYLRALKNWKANDPVPLFINLAVEDNLKSRWNWLIWLIDQNSLKEQLKFSLFSGITKKKMILFIDSFDETPVKLNYIEKFFNELGNNSSNKCLICCRSEFVQNYQDFQKWFGSDNGTLLKEFIAPLEHVKSFKINNYANQFYKGYDIDLSQEDIKQIIQKIEQQNLKSIMKTGYMVHLSLQVLPNLLKDDHKITRRTIYEKYTQIKMFRVDSAIQNLLKVKFNQFEEFVLESALCLASLLHKMGTSKLIYSREKGITKNFFDRVDYKSNLGCLANNYLAAVIRCLDLNVETRGNVPEENITLGFSHDSMKNYFLISSIMKECQEGKNINILSEKMIVEDVSLIKFIVEVVKEKADFKDQLKNIIFQSRKESKNMSVEEEKKDKGKVIAAANAISILIAANVSFSGCDLNKIRICGANLNDGMFCVANLSEADLSGVILENAKLDGALFYRTKLTDLKMGIYPEISAKSPIYSCCFSPDGDKIFAGCGDGCIKVWDRKQENKLVMSLGGQSLGIFSKDGRYIASDGIDNTIKLWELSSGSLIKTFDGHANSVNSLAFSLNGKYILSGSADNSIKLWDVSSGCLSKAFEGHSSSVTSVVFSPDEKFILSGSCDNSIKLWEFSSGSLIKSFEGHSDFVNCIAFSSDGKLILSGSRDKSIKLWDVSSGFLIKTFEGDSESVNSVVFSQDGKCILVGSQDKSIKLWDVSSGLLIKTYDHHSSSVNSVAFSSDEKLIVSGSLDKSIKLWDVSSGSLIKNFECHTDSVNSVAFSPDGKLILSGSLDKSIKLWDVSSGSLIKTLDGHNDSVNSVVLSQDGKLILSKSDDLTIKLWDFSSGSLIRTLDSDNSYVNSVVFSPDAKLVLGGSLDESIKIWDVSSGLLINSLNGHTDTVNSVAFSPDGKLILSGSGDKLIILWDASSGLPIKTFYGNDESVNYVVFSPDAKFILSASLDYSIKLWEISSGSLVKTLNSHNSSVNSMVFSADGKLILSGSGDKSIKLWDVSSGSLIKTFDGHTEGVNGAVFSQDEKLILSGSLDKMIKFWDVSSGSLVKILDGHNSNVKSVVFSPDGMIILSGSDDNSIKLWDVASSSLIRTLDGHNSYVNSVVFSTDGKLILSGSSDKSIKLWDASSGALINTFEGHNSEVSSVDFSPDGKFILSGSWDKSIKLWDISSRSLINTLIGHNSHVNSVVFSPNGKLILSGSWDKSIKLWDVSSGSLIKTLDGHNNSVISVVFSPNGNLILSGSWDMSIKLWDVSSGVLIKSLDNLNSYVLSVVFSPDGKFILSGCGDKSIKLWDVSSGSLISTLDGHKSDVNSVVFSPNGKLILSGSSDKSIKLWCVSLSVIKTLDDHNSDVNLLVFSSEKKLILSRYDDKSIKLWDISSGTILFSFESFNCLPISISRPFKLFPCPYIDNFCICTLSLNETCFSCKNMIIIDPIELPLMYSQVFKNNEALFTSIASQTI